MGLRHVTELVGDRVMLAGVAVTLVGPPRRGMRGLKASGSRPEPWILRIG